VDVSKPYSPTVAFGAAGLVAYACAAGSPDEGALDASAGPDASAADSHVTVAACGQQNEPCCADAGCSADGSFCSAANVCKSATPTDIGVPCAGGSTCMSGVCTQLQGLDASSGALPPSDAVCSEPCDTTSDCFAGWTCEIAQPGSPAPPQGKRGICVCSPVVETCDGKDDNCDGVIDEEPQADKACSTAAGAPEQCRDAGCMCVTQCDGGCVDLASDVNNCGACGHACVAGVQACQNSACACAGTLCAVPDGGVLGDGGYIIPDGGPGGGPVACVQTVSDPHNCGACGVTCKYACSGGGCVPFELATLTSTGGFAVASNGTDVFIMTASQGGVIEECAVTGCNLQPSQVAALNGTNNAGSSGQLALGGSWLYWPEQSTVNDVTTATPTTTVFAQPANGSVNAVATNSTNVFWSDENLGILTCPIGATCVSPTTLLGQASLAAPPQMIVADAAYVYWSDANGDVLSYPIATPGSGSQVTLATGINDPQPAMAASAGRVYFSNGNGASGGGVVLGTALGGTASSATVYYAGQNVTAITTDGTNLYWSDAGTNQILRCAVGASCATPKVIRDVDSAPSIAVDANNIYWIDGSGTVPTVWEFAK
jgi:hypothetical protein